MYKYIRRSSLFRTAKKIYSNSTVTKRSVVLFLDFKPLLHL